MANTIKESILAEIADTLEDMSPTVSISRGLSTSVDLNSLPAAVVYEISDMVVDTETNLLLVKEVTVAVEFWVEDMSGTLQSSITDLEGRIIQAILTNNTQGGYASVTELGKSRRLLLQDDPDMGGGYLDFVVTYRVNEENPFSTV